MFIGDDEEDNTGDKDTEEQDESLLGGDAAFWKKPDLKFAKFLLMP